MSHRENAPPGVPLSLRGAIELALHVTDLPGSKHPVRTSEVGVSGSRSPLYRSAYFGTQSPTSQDRHRWTLRSPIVSSRSCSLRLRLSPTRIRSSDSPRSAGTGAMSSLKLPPFGPPSLATTNLILRSYCRDPSPAPSTLPSTYASCQRRLTSLPDTPTE